MDGFAATLTTLRPASGHERAELIRDVIDAFRRLRTHAMEHGWHQNRIIGKPLRWLGKHVP